MSSSRSSKGRLRSDSPHDMEQGEVPSSPHGQASPEILFLEEHEDDLSLSEEEEEGVEAVEEEAAERHEDDDALEIKPPQRQAGKKDRHKHRHRDDRGRDRDRDRDRDRSRHLDRDSIKGWQWEREKERDRHDKSSRSLEKQKLKEQELEKEAKRREKSRKERERLEGLERERHRLERERQQREREHRERLIRAEREREREMAERVERKREEERRRQAASSRQGDSHHRREKDRGRKSGTVSSSIRSRSPHRRETHPERDSSHSSRSKARQDRERQPEKPPPEPVELPEPAVAPPSEEEEEMEVEATEEAEHFESEGEVAKSSSDSESESSESGSDSTASDVSSEHSPQKHAEHRVTSKFDDDQEEEEEEEDELPGSQPGLHDENGETESVQQSDREEEEEEEEENEYIEDTPPDSPVELKPVLPPYFPAIQGCRNVEEFHCLNRIEEGTYGVVYRARDKKTDEIVALKKLKMEKEKEGFPITSLREINTLLKAQHVNIVTVREIVVGSNIDKIYIVMDYVEHDLKSLMETMKEPFIIGEVKTLMIQLLRGVAHLHDNWIIHRDLKTSNLLLSHKGILKIGDFGLAREYGSPLRQYTPIVVTLWYRAPELLLGIKEYACPIDMWSVGCIFAEFLTRKPLFPGRSDIDELNRIFKELGTPNEKIWAGVSELPGMKKCSFSEYPYNQLRNRFGAILSDKGFDLMNRFLTYNPARRIIAEEGIRHEWFKEAPKQVPPSMFPTWPARSEQTKRSQSGNSPKPPSGGKAFSKLLGDDDDQLRGFHLGLATKGHAATGAGFALKF